MSGAEEDRKQAARAEQVALFRYQAGCWARLPWASSSPSEMARQGPGSAARRPSCREARRKAAVT